ncbi:thiamin-phosphate pyrophosphorylase, putative [Hepatocystis sp. ex Piliocolobus tephrosceles]|nr:thiamin-phosphate pyrophosphorylase, putative [Hepatocystis sp. ex Piliocolobus tephrosceles]
MKRGLKNIVDYSLYLVTDDKFLKDKEKVCEEFINKIKKGVLGGAGIVQLRLKKSNDLYFYNTALTLKKCLLKYNIPLIINNRTDICLGVNADGVHIGKTDIPINVVRNILGEDKIIGATINFSNDKDIEMAINNNLDYIVHEQTLYKSNTKDTQVAYEEGLKKQIYILQNKIKYLKENGRIPNLTDTTHPPIIMIGGINTNNIKQTMQSFYTTCTGVAVVSDIIKNECDSFLNALKLKFIINKYKKNDKIAFVNLYNSCLRYIFYNSLQNSEDKTPIETDDMFFQKGECINETENNCIHSEVVTNVNVNNFLFPISNRNFKLIPLKQIIENNNKKTQVFFFYTPILSYNKTKLCNQPSGMVYDDYYINKWIEKNKNEKIINNIFIFIGTNLLDLFIKQFSSTFLNSNLFFIITKNAPINIDLFKTFESIEIKNASILYSANFINIVLNNNIFDDAKIENLGFLLSYFLIAQKYVTPKFLSQFLCEKINVTEEKQLKNLGVIDIALEIFQNER